MTARVRPVGFGVLTTLLAGGFLVLGSWLPTETQTRIVADKNKYSVADDVKLGQEAAAQVRKELPLLSDAQVDAWVQDVGRRLAAAIPPEFAKPEFRYTFEVVNQKEINAFALPGGPMFLNRGMIEAGHVEGEVAGVMGHEISHVALRHGTAQATKSQRFQLGALAGQILGTVVGGNLGGVISQGSQLGLGTYVLKYGREYERQADLLGAQILARAGYDPRQMANMFKTIAAEGGGRTPEWLSSHPDPNNRYNTIIKESATLRVQGDAVTGRFDMVRARLRGMPPALTAEEIAKGKSTSAPTSSERPRTVRVDPPAAATRTYQPGSFLRLSVPSNWQATGGNDGGVTYAPDGGFRQDGNQTTFTHGLQIGLVRQASGDLQRDTEQLLQGFAQSNPQLRRQESRRETIGGRTGITTMLSNVSDGTGQDEVVAVSTVQLRDRNVLFLIGVSPRTEASTYAPVFTRVRQSVQITDR